MKKDRELEMLTQAILKTNSPASRACFGTGDVMTALGISDKNFVYTMIEHGAPIFKMGSKMVCHTDNVHDFIKNWKPAEAEGKKKRRP